MTKKDFMKLAIDLSIENIDKGGGPFGAVIVKDNKVIAASGNSVTNDLAIVNFDLKLTDGNELTVQKIKQTLLLFEGEWFLNNFELTTPSSRIILTYNYKGIAEFDAQLNGLCIPKTRRINGKIDILEVIEKYNFPEGLKMTVGISAGDNWGSAKKVDAYLDTF